MEKLQFHVHDDIDTIRNYIPLAFFDFTLECYIMQQNRIVFIGPKRMAEVYIKVNENKYMKQDYKQLNK